MKTWLLTRYILTFTFFATKQSFFDKWQIKKKKKKSVSLCEMRGFCSAAAVFTSHGCEVDFQLSYFQRSVEAIVLIDHLSRFVCRRGDIIHKWGLAHSLLQDK